MKVIILQGISGAGKTYYAEQTAAACKLHGQTVSVVSATDFFVKLGGGTYKYDPTRLSEAHGECFRNFLYAISAEEVDVVIVDNTNLTLIEIAPYEAAARAFEYEVEVHRILCEPEIAIERAPHGVPHRKIFDSARRLQTKYPPWWKVVDIEAWLG